MQRSNLAINGTISTWIFFTAQLCQILERKDFIFGMFRLWVGIEEIKNLEKVYFRESFFKWLTLYTYGQFQSNKYVADIIICANFADKYLSYVKRVTSHAFFEFCVFSVLRFFGFAFTFWSFFKTLKSLYFMSVHNP